MYTYIYIYQIHNETRIYRQRPARKPPGASNQYTIPWNQSRTNTHERDNNKPTLVDYPLRLDNTRSCNHIHTDAF